MGRTVGRRAAAVAVGLMADALVGEPPRWHPVAGFGAAMTALERRWWADDRFRGVLHAGLGVAAATGVGRLASVVAGPWTSLVAATWTAAAGRALLDAATAAGTALSSGDLDGARQLLPTLVGRSTAGLDEKEAARALVESVAENLSDAVLGTVVWGVVGGAPAVLAHRAANTLDAMVGHRSDRYRRFGWAAARTDDVLGWPAARATAALVALAAPARAGAVWTAVRRDAPAHPSPNAGVAEAAFAAALDVRLGGTNRYGDRVEARPSLGTGRAPAPGDVAAAVALARRVIALLIVGLLVLGACAVAPAGEPAGATGPSARTGERR